MADTVASHRSNGVPVWWRWAIAVVVLIVLWILFPPFRIVRLGSDGAVVLEKSETADLFNAAEFVEGFWDKTLVPAFESVPDLNLILKDLVADPIAAREKYGRKIGVGTTVYYFVKGVGEVVEVKGRRAVVDIEGIEINLLVGPPVFGNSIRDGCGLLSVNDVPGLEEYNALSSVLNTKVETDVLPMAVERAVVGARISFVGCAKAPERVGSGPVIEIIPLRVGVVEL